MCILEPTLSASLIQLYTSKQHSNRTNPYKFHRLMSTSICFCVCILYTFVFYAWSACMIIDRVKLISVFSSFNIVHMHINPECTINNKQKKQLTILNTLNAAHSQSHSQHRPMNLLPKGNSFSHTPHMVHSIYIYIIIIWKRYKSKSITNNVSKE